MEYALTEEDERRRRMQRPRSGRLFLSSPEMAARHAEPLGRFPPHHGLVACEDYCLPSMSEDTDGAILSTLLSVQGLGRLL